MRMGIALGGNALLEELRRPAGGRMLEEDRLSPWFRFSR